MAASQVKCGLIWCRLHALALDGLSSILCSLMILLGRLPKSLAGEPIPRPCTAITVHLAR
jgi:hypothetical protein